MSRLRCRPALAAALAAAAFALSGCGGPASLSDEAGAPAVAPVQRDEGAAGQAGDSTKVTPQKAAPTPDAPQAGPRAIVYTGEMTVRVKDVTAATDTAKRIVAGAGGRLDGEQAAALARQDTSTLVFKIPPDHYATVTDRLGKELGTRVSLRLSTEDVTEEIADVGSRVKSAKAGLDQLRSLLKKAKNVSEVLKVEREISGREADLEALQARQRSLATRVADGTLTLHVEGPVRREPMVHRPKPQPPNFFTGLRSGWTTLKQTARVGLAVFGALLPWLAVLAVLWAAYVGARRGIRALRRGRGGDDGPGVAVPPTPHPGAPPEHALPGNPSSESQNSPERPEPPAPSETPETRERPEGEAPLADRPVWPFSGPVGQGHPPHSGEPGRLE
ncbi:DUF4349 domain-containing protein [Sphaerisporangium rhizosphaerae]|uniref:DUF4349 domain-containing protein n=1 Tax=Sphaerisporangium rhizosphaerae TaxID=2269375 RepID=A0ABW2NYV0_9ACTN